MVLDGFPWMRPDPDVSTMALNARRASARGVVSHLHRGATTALADKVERVLLVWHTIETLDFEELDSQVSMRMDGDEVKLWKDFPGSHANNLTARGF